MRYDEYNDYHDGDHNKSPSRLEEEVRETRAHMDETLDALGDRLEPRRLASDVWHGMTDRLPSGAGGNTGEMIQNAGRDIGRRVANHPVPAALVGLGVIWLLSEEAAGRSATGEGAARRGRDAASSAADAGRDAANRAGAKGRDIAGAAKHQGQRFAGAIGSTASEVSHRASEMTSSAAGYASDAARRTAQAASDTAQRAAAATSRTANRTAGATADAYDSRPLLFGALACAAGFIAGISTPKTRAEKKAFGETGRDIRRRAGDFSKEMGKQAGRHMAETAAETGEKLAEDAERAARKAADMVQEETEPEHERSHQTT